MSLTHSVRKIHPVSCTSQKPHLLSSPIAVRRGCWKRAFSVNLPANVSSSILLCTLKSDLAISLTPVFRTEQICVKSLFLNDTLVQRANRFNLGIYCCLCFNTCIDPYHIEKKRKLGSQSLSTFITKFKIPSNAESSTGNRYVIFILNEKSWSHLRNEQCQRWF